MVNCSEDKIVARLAEILSLESGIHPVMAGQIRTACVFHDIGKQKIPEGILNKPGRLTEKEFELMKTHTYLGAEMLQSVQGRLGVIVRNISLYHHEWWDGSGYWGRYTDELPAYVSIVAAADVFTALICKRPYKPAWTVKDALAYMKKQVGTQFAPAVIKRFIPLVQKDNRIQAVLKEVV